MVVIKKVEKEDVEEILKLHKIFVEIHKEFDSDFYNTKQNVSEIWKNYALGIIDNEDRLFIVAKEEDIVGYAIATIKKRPPIYEEEYSGNIDAIVVSPDHRNRGIASELLNHCLEWFKNKKVCYVESFIDSKNIGSIKLHEKYNFKEYQKRMLFRNK